MYWVSFMKWHPKDKEEQIMDMKFDRHNTEVPERIMEILRQRRYLDEYDESEDQEILAMSGREFLEELLGWEGILGYTDYIIEIIEMAYGISLDDWPFDETIKREIED